MSYGVVTTRECPVCRTDLDYVDFTDDPPPIPASYRGGFRTLNGYIDSDGQWLYQCPHCEADLDRVT